MNRAFAHGEAARNALTLVAFLVTSRPRSKGAGQPNGAHFWMLEGLSGRLEKPADRDKQEQRVPGTGHAARRERRALAALPSVLLQWSSADFGASDVGFRPAAAG